MQPAASLVACHSLGSGLESYECPLCALVMCLCTCACGVLSSSHRWCCACPLCLSLLTSVTLSLCLALLHHMSLCGRVCAEEESTLTLHPVSRYSVRALAKTATVSLGSVFPQGRHCAAHYDWSVQVQGRVTLSAPPRRACSLPSTPISVL